MSTLDETIGMAMEQTKLPYIISFMIRKDGRLNEYVSIDKVIVEIRHEYPKLLNLQ